MGIPYFLLPVSLILHFIFWVSPMRKPCGIWPCGLSCIHLTFDLKMHHFATSASSFSCFVQSSAPQCKCYIFFIQSSVVGYTDCIYSLAVMNCAAVNVSLHAFLYCSVFNPLRKISKEGQCGQMEFLLLVF